MSREPARAGLAISNHGLRNSGGIERYAMTIVRGLHERGVKPTLIAKTFDASLPEYGWVRPVRVPIGLVPSKLRDLWFDWQIGRIKRRLGLAPLIGCNQTRWSDIGICGSTHPGFLRAMGRRAGRIDRWKIALERAHLEHARVVVAHSRGMRQEACDFYGIDPGKVVLLYPPVDVRRFSPVDDTQRTKLRRSLGLPQDRAVFLLASTGHARKGLGLLTAFFASTDLPICLVVAGRRPDAPAPHVRYLGYRTDMQDVYRAADYTVVASHYEPFGLVGVESVLCGTPVLLAEQAGCAEVIQAPAQLPFSPERPDTLELAVEQAVRRWREERHRLLDPASHLRYDPRVSVHVDALLRLVDDLCPPEPNPTPPPATA